MAKCDPNIYGADETSFASGVAADALANPKPDVWSGKPIDNSAKSRSSSDSSLKLDDAAPEATVKITKLGLGDTSKARTEGQHGKQG